MTTDPRDPAPPAAPGPRKWRRNSISLRDGAAIVLGMSIFGVLKALSREAGLSRWQFLSLLLSGLGALFAIAHLVSRWRAARRAEPPKQ